MKRLLLFLSIIFIFTGCSDNNKEINSNINHNSTTQSSLPELKAEENIIEPTLDETIIVTPKLSSTNKPSPTNATIPTPSSTPTESLPTKSLLPTPPQEKEYEVGNNVNNKALDFKSKNLSGTDINLSDYLGKKVFLNFWATWCGPCTKELPSIQKLHENYQDIVVLTVNCGEDAEDIKSFMEKNNYTFNVLTDESGTISHLYLTDYIPLTLVIDEKGIIKERHVGSLTEKEMIELIKKGE